MEMDVPLTNVFLLESVVELTLIASAISPMENVPKECLTLLIKLLVSFFTRKFTLLMETLQTMHPSLQLTQMETHPQQTSIENAKNLHVTMEHLPTILVIQEEKETILALVST